MFVPCDFDAVFVLDLDTLDLVVVAFWLLELLRLLRCFVSASVLLHLLVFGLECVALRGLAEEASGRGPAGSDPNTPGRVEGPVWRPALTTEARWWEASLFMEEERDSPNVTRFELHDVELDVCELDRKLEKELEDLATLEVMTWVLKELVPPPPTPHPPARLLLSILL